MITQNLNPWCFGKIAAPSGFVAYGDAAANECSSAIELGVEQRPSVRQGTTACYLQRGRAKADACLFQASEQFVRLRTSFSHSSLD